MNRADSLKNLNEVFAVLASPDGEASRKSSCDSLDEDGRLSPSCTSIDASSDEHSASEQQNYYPGCFEGPEKTMEVFFAPDKGVPNGLRNLTRTQLDLLCTKAKCTILSSISNSYIDAYVLSESSMFVYKHRFIMKTCGTTTLLKCLGSLLEFADALEMELTWVGYSRKNLMFPGAQMWPHSNFGEEINYLNSHGKLQDRLGGSGYILGPITGDHWFVYAADHTPPLPTGSIVPIPSMERTINMMMFDMAPEVADLFYLKSGLSGKEMTKKSGIDTLLPGAQIDESAFTPCGYSMNSILHDAYSTIHITPEPQCSYVSFETNTCLKNYAPMIRNVLNVFRPKRFVLTLFGDDAAIESLQELPTDAKRIEMPALGGGYNRTSLSSTKVEIELNCMMACFSLDSSPYTSSVPQKDRAYSFA